MKQIFCKMGVLVIAAALVIALGSSKVRRCPPSCTPVPGKKRE